MKIIVDNIATLYYDAPSNASREEEDRDPKNCSKIAQTRVCCSLGYIYKHIGTRKFLRKPLWVYSHLKSGFLFLIVNYLLLIVNC